MTQVLTYGGRGPDARTVIVYGNCQVPFLARLLSGIDDFNDDYRFVFATNHGLPGEEVPVLPDEYFSDVALVIEQHDERATVPAREAMRARLPADCPRLSFPSLIFTCLWPFECPPPPRPAEARFPWGRYPHGDGIVQHMAAMGVDLAAAGAFDTYMELAAQHMPDLNARLQRDIARLEACDAVCDVTFKSYILDNFRSRRLFWSWGHTSSVPLAELALRIWAVARPVIGGTVERAEGCIAAAAAEFEGIGDIQVPIHPLVASTFGLSFWSPDMRYMWFGQHWTFREYIERYMRYDTAW